MNTRRIFLVSLASTKRKHHLVSPPLGLLYLAGYLRTRGHYAFRIVNQALDEPCVDDLVRQARDFDSDVVGIRSLTTSAHDLPALTRKLRAALPKALIVLGGPHIDAFGEEAMQDTEAHAAVPGEGERAIEQVLNAWFGEGGRFAEIPGLIWRPDHGPPVVNPGRIPLIDDLDSLPFPAYDLIDIRAYWRVHSMTGLPRRTHYISMFSSRGCPYGCTYCHHIQGKAFRPHSAERIVEEIEHYQRAFGIRDVEFLDDIFNLDRRRVLDFCDLARRRGLRFKIAFPNAIRGDILTEEVVDALTETGLCFTALAVETASPRLQTLIGKNLKLDRLLQGLDWLTQRRVYASGFFMLGFPTETEEELQLTIRTACNAPFHYASFFIVMPYPKTELYRQARELCPDRLRDLDYRDREYQNVRMNLSEVPDRRLWSLRGQAYRRFFLNPQRIYRLLRDVPYSPGLPHMAAQLPLFLKRLAQ